MWILVVVIAGLYLYTKSKSVTSTPTQVGTASVPPLANKSGGTSTMKLSQISQAEKLIPPFYQQSNAATASQPATTQNVGSLTRILPQNNVLHNNLRLVGTFTESGNQSIMKPIAGDIINDNEVEQIAYENEVAIGKGSVAVPIAIENPPIFNSPVIIKPSTINAPSAVEPTAPYYAANGVPNTLAPNPLPNPSFETTVPVIAAAIIKNSYIPESDPLARTAFSIRGNL